MLVALLCNDVSNWGAIPLGINIRPDRLMLAALVVAFQLYRRQERTRVPIIFVERVMLFFFVVLFVSMILYGTIISRANHVLSKLVTFTILPALLFMMARRIVYDDAALRALRRAFLLVAIYLGVIAVFEVKGMESWVWPGYIMDFSRGLHQGRARGPFLQAVINGAALSLACQWVLWYHYNIRKHWLTWLAVPLAVAGCYLTNTRSVWLQVAAGIAVIGVFKTPLRKFTRWAIFVLIIVYFSGVASKFSAYEISLFKRRNEQIDDRWNIYNASWRMFQESPVFGHGYGSFEKIGDNYFVEIEGVQLRGQGEGQHHTFLGLLAENGLVGTIPFCIIYGTFFGACFRRYRADDPGDPVGRSFSVMILALLSGNVVAMQFSDYGFYSYINCITFWSAGMVFARFNLKDASCFAALSSTPKSVRS